MIVRRTHILPTCLCVCRVRTALAAWIGAYYLRFSGLFPIPKDQPPFEWCRDDLPMVMALAAIAFWLTKNYEIHRLRRLREDLWTVLKGVPLLVLLVTGAAFFLQDDYVSRGAMVAFAALAFLAVLVTRRLTWWGVHFLRRRGYNPSFSLIVGT